MAEATAGIAPAADAAAADPNPRTAWWRGLSRRRRAFVVLGAAFLAVLLWLALAAPVARTLSPPEAKSLLFVTSDGEAIARRGAVIDAPVRIDQLPDHVWQPFVAIEDRRFRGHPGVDPIGLTRAMWRNLTAFGLREGGSTITQQLAKQIYLTSDRTVGRKLREMLIALWLEAHLSKDEILERYLSSVYLGNNLYGLRAASKAYFGRDPEELRVEQAALLAAIVKAPSRLAPTDNLSGARERADLVLDAMVEQDMLTDDEADRLPRVRLNPDQDRLPQRTYFTDWLLSGPTAPQEADGQTIVTTTLDSRLQKFAEEAVRRVPSRAQVALVAMRPDGQILAMIGGRSYSESAYNRVTQARRQPGSTFKLFVYLTALEEGMTPDDLVLDAPIAIDDWSPANADGRYEGMITLREAFARSSNVAAVRLAEQVGRRDVIATARRLGISSDLEPAPSLALGTSTTTLLEMTGAFAAVAANRFPVAPRGLPENDDSWLGKISGGAKSFDDRTVGMMRHLLSEAVYRGTGRAAALGTPTFGKTGTTQDNRDAIFIGYAGDVVAGVWIGRDDNGPLSGISGGDDAASIWRNFMARALSDETPAFASAPALLTRREPSRAREYRSSGRGKGRGKGKRKKRR